MRSLIIIIALFAFSCSTPLVEQTKDEAGIRIVLDAQIKAWNQGNLEAFMETYWKSDSLIFVGKNGPTYGWQPTLDNYKKGYPDTAAMGKLSFNLLEFKKLGDDVYFVVGKWMLARSIGDVSGHFTILLRRINGDWKIIADHSS